MININECFRTFEQAKRYLNSMYDRYHPAGYGTKLQIRKTFEGFEVNGYRFVSCK